MNFFLLISHNFIISAVSVTAHQSILQTASNMLMSAAEEVVKYIKCLPAYQKKHQSVVTALL